MAKEWFDDPAWDSAAQADFRRRLSRARNQKLFYLGRKISAVAQHDPGAALCLCEERLALAAEDDERYRVQTQKAGLLAAMGRHGEMLQVMDQAIGSDIIYHAVLAGEFCCLVGYFGRAELYERALQILDELDTCARREAGRTFRSCAALAARALINYKSGRKEEAVQPARDALELSLERSAMLSAFSTVKHWHEFPGQLNDILIVIGGLWDEKALGPPPNI